MKLLIPVAAGLEGSVQRQLKYLGYKALPAENGRIAVEGDISDVARLNVFLRAGERVLILLAKFPAATFDELYEGVYAVPWEEYLSRDSRIVMDGKSGLSALGAIKAAGGVAKKAIIRRLADKLNPSGAPFNRKTFPETGARTVVGVSIFKNVAAVTVDTSGEGLHKRGYRTLAYDAPLKETLAAGILDGTYYHGDFRKPFADPFCGSGTFPVEAALSMRNIAPGKNRDFDFAHWRRCAGRGTDEIQSALARAREEAEDTQIRGGKLNIYASDISPRAVSVAEYHAGKAGVKEDIVFSVAPAQKFTSAEKYGVLVCNPPYGERLSSAREVEKIYRDFSEAFFALPDWSGYILTGYPDFQ
ncbi:MAG: class I SAM-dependent RNA methyltransferase, partial [Candidatus Scatosoma sp.]